MTSDQGDELRLRIVDANGAQLFDIVADNTPEGAELLQDLMQTLRAELPDQGEQWRQGVDELPPVGVVIELRHTPDSTDPGESPDLGTWRATSTHDGLGFFADPVSPTDDWGLHGNAWWDDVRIEWRRAEPQGAQERQAGS